VQLVTLVAVFSIRSYGFLHVCRRANGYTYILHLVLVLVRSKVHIKKRTGKNSDGDLMSSKMEIGPEHEPKYQKNLEAICFRGISGRKARKSYGYGINNVGK
jgi:hypothetical protein